MQTGSLLTLGADKVGQHYESTASLKPLSSPCGPSQRLFIESSKKSLPTFCLDLCREGKSPGFSPSGLAAIPNPAPVYVLFRVFDNKITHIWLLKAPLDPVTPTSKESVMDSPVWSKLQELLTESTTEKRVDWKYYLSIYTDLKDEAGLGLGSSSKTINW
eukprot:Lithocolla_globosa_v1_NODE_4477_length_1425_cov_2.712409.p1 type:complete len:160 gc:universal NODE_4477_length_1425_cov_2.712409:728-1207(+)